MMNDAAMQALGGYEGGSMLYLGLGSGFGSALIMNGQIAALELGCLRYDADRTLGDMLGHLGLERLGQTRLAPFAVDFAYGTAMTLAR